MPVTRWDNLLGPRRNIIYLVACVVVLAGLLAVPRLSLTGFALASLTTALLLATRAQAWNFIGGYTGYAAFGNVAFYGLGAYGTAILMTKAHWPFIPAMLAGALVATVYAVIIGEDEVKAGTATLRRMADAVQETVPMTELIEKLRG